MVFKKQTQGQAIILIVLAIIGLFGITALAVDGGNAFADRRHAQSAADNAALAAALAIVNNQSMTDAAYGITRANGRSDETVTVNNPPLAGCDGSNGPYVANNDYIQVIIRSDVNTFFAPIIGITQLHHCVEAVAYAKPPVTTPIAFGSAMASLNQHDCKTYWVHGTANTEVIGSGIFVNSDCATGAFQAFDQSGNATITAPSICVVGGATYEAGDVTPPPQTSCGTQLPYPPEYIWPQPICTEDGTETDGVLTPGNIPGSWLSGDVTLEPGVYCISGDATINANDNIVGDGVLLYFIDGSPHMNGGATMDLTAATTGEFAGLLIYLPITNDSTVIMNGNSDSAFTGTILAPASEIQINGTESAYGYHSQVIGYTVDLIGTADTTIIYNDSENYDITLPPSIEIVQ